jgi:TonB-linked SusC/RagA family outer membrane protein
LKIPRNNLHREKKSILILISFSQSSQENSPNQPFRPLFIIDGKASTKRNQTSGQTSPDPKIKSLQPAEIISMRFIKPEIARIKYGERAKQGVILVKTKTGSRRYQPRLLFSAYSGVQWVARRPEVLDARGFTQLANEAYLNSGQNAPYPATSFPINTHWQDEIFNTGDVQNYQLSLNGRKKKSSYLVYANYLRNQSPVLGASQEQVSAKISAKWDLSDNLKAGGQALGSFGKIRGLYFPLDSGVSESLISQALFYPPTISPSDLNLFPADINGLKEGIANPIATTEQRVENFDRRLGMAQAWLNGQWGNFSFQSKWAFDNITDRRDQFVSGSFFRGNSLKNLSVSDLSTFSQNYQFEYTFNHILSYRHQLNILNKLEHQYQDWKFDRQKATGLTSTGAPLNSATTLSSYDATNRWHQYSALLRTSYNYNHRYYFTGNIRVQTSPQFAPQNQSIVLPSFSANWDLHDEYFFRRRLGYFINVLQIGTSYGISGNEQARIFPQLSNLIWNHPGSFQTDLLSYAWLADRTQDLGWERTQEWDFSLRTVLWQNHIEFSATRYHKRTRDVLTLTNLPGEGYQWQNLGMVTNKGWELNTRVMGTSIGRLRINGGGNITFNDNEVNDLGNLDQQTIPGVLGSGPLSEAIMILEPGEPIGNFYGYKTDGLYQAGDNFDLEPEKAPGDIRLVDTNHDGIIDQNDKTVIGNAISRFFYGINLNLGYQKLSASINFKGSHGNDIMNYNLLSGRDAIDGSTNLFAVAMDRWTPENTQTDIPRPTLNPETRITDRLIEDGSYLRLADATITYDFQMVNVGKVNFKEVKVYVKGQNLLLFTKYSGYDPEVLLYGNLPFTTLPIDRGAYPRPRSVLVGIDFSL